MSRSPDECKRAAGVAVGLCLMLGWMACGHPDPIPYRPGSGGASGLAIPVSGGGSVAAAGSVSSPAGIGGVAGIGGWVAGIGGVAGYGGSPGMAGVVAAMGGTGAVVALPPFDAGSDPNRNRVMPGMLCARMAVIDCAGEQHCCNSPGRTVDACRADVMKTCSDGYLDEIAMDPITGFDQSAATAAFTTLEQKASQCDTTVAAWGASTDGLRGILKGTLAANANCKPSQPTTDTATLGAALASCTGIATTACLPKSLLGQWTCAPKNASGAGCASDYNCNDGLYCNAPAMMLGKCARRLAVGASCSAPNQCESLYCKGGKCVAADQQVAYCLGTK
jgi:hypothetical protein